VKKRSLSHHKALEYFFGSLDNFLKKQKTQKSANNNGKFSKDCQGRTCSAYALCQTGHRIIDSQSADSCLAMRKRFEIKKIREKKETEARSMVEALIKETTATN
jgi:hypothetical protein